MRTSFRLRTTRNEQRHNSVHYTMCAKILRRLGLPYDSEIPKIGRLDVQFILKRLTEFYPTIPRFPELQNRR